MAAKDVEINAAKDEPAAETSMSLTAHLSELRRRLIICFIAVGIGFGVCYYYSKPLFKVIMLPLLDILPKGDTLIYTSLPEAFFTYLKVGFWGGVVLAVPVIAHQLWCFLAPGLYRHERRYLIPFMFFATVLFGAGCLFGYFVVFPFGFKFFLGFADESIRAMPAVKQYFSLALKLLLGFGLAFELPVVMAFLAKMGLVDARFLTRNRKFAFLLVFVAGAILTPPDIVSQVLMALPLIVLYEISIILVRLIRSGKEDEPEAASEPAVTKTLNDSEKP